MFKAFGDFLATVRDWILGLSAGPALLVVFMLPALEASIMLGFLIPGETAILLGGVLAQQGRVALWTVILVACLGAVIGDQIGYFIGRRYGEQFLNKVPDRILDDKKIKASQVYVRRLGSKAIILGRWTAALRALVPGIAGMSHMPYRQFLAANVFGGCGWAVAVAFAGYAAGGSYKKAEKYFSSGGLVLLGIAVLGIVITLVIARRRQEEHKLDELASEAEDTTTA